MNSANSYLYFLRQVLIGVALLVTATLASLSLAATTYTYDPLSRLSRVDYGNGQVVDYTYDSAGNRLTRVVVAPNTVSIATAVSPVASGVASGSGAKVLGSTVTVSATPAVGFRFVGWTESGLAVSSLPSYSFVALANRSLVANFAAGGAAVLALSPAALNFPGQLVGTSSVAQNVTVSNTGSAPLALAGISAAGDFGQANACASVLDIGASCAVSVVFTPTAIGARNGLISVASDAGTQSVPLAGIGLPVSAATLSADQLLFGSRPLLTPGAPQTVTLTNGGSAPLAIAAIGITGSGDFSRTTTCGSSLAVGASCTVSVSLRPTDVGSRDGLLLIDSDAPGSPHAVVLGGFSTQYADLDADGRADILWRHSADGQNAVWLMDGTVSIGGGSASALTDLNWKAIGLGDFNADGKADILWRHGVDGRNSVWLMDGAVRIGGGQAPLLADQNWKAVGLGDFNADGRTDILWRHGVDGRNSIWFMNGAARIGGGQAPLLADLNWRVEQVADFDMDGRADILWHHAGDGRNSIWLMEGTARIGGGLINKMPSLEWEVVP